MCDDLTHYLGNRLFLCSCAFHRKNCIPIEINIAIRHAFFNVTLNMARLDKCLQDSPYVCICRETMGVTDRAPCELDPTGGGWGSEVDNRQTSRIEPVTGT